MSAYLWPRYAGMTTPAASAVDAAVRARKEPGKSVQVIGGRLQLLDESDGRSSAEAFQP